MEVEAETPSTHSSSSAQVRWRNERPVLQPQEDIDNQEEEEQQQQQQFRGSKRAITRQVSVDPPFLANTQSHVGVGDLEGDESSTLLPKSALVQSGEDSPIIVSVKKKMSEESSGTSFGRVRFDTSLLHEPQAQHSKSFGSPVGRSRSKSLYDSVNDKLIGTAATGPPLNLDKPRKSLKFTPNLVSLMHEGQEPPPSTFFIGSQSMEGVAGSSSVVQSLQVEDSGGTSNEGKKKRKKLTTSEKVNEVQARAVQHQRLMREAAAALVEGTKERTEEALSRKRALERKKDVVCASMWSSIIIAMQYSLRMRDELERIWAMKTLQLRLMPMMVLKIRKYRRHVRQKDIERNLPVPPLSVLMSDPMLRHFGADHLTAVIEGGFLKAHYFAQSEIIFYKGSEGCECFVLMNGEMETVAEDGAREATSTPLVFGALSMITGEPYINTLRTLKPSYLWSVSRSDFYAAAPNPAALQLAVTVVTELHEKNIPHLYRPLLKPEFWTKFRLFSGIPSHLVALLVNTPGVVTPKAFRAGENIMTAGTKAAYAMFLLRGTVVVKLDPSVPLPEGMSLEEALTYTCDIVELARSIRSSRKRFFSVLVDKYEKRRMRERDMTEMSTLMQQTNATSHLSQSQQFVAASSVRPRSPAHYHQPATEPITVAEIGPYTFFGLANLLQRKEMLFTVEAVGATDAALLQSKKALIELMQDPLTLFEMKRQATQIRADFVKPLEKSEIINAMFPHTLYPMDLRALKISTLFPSMQPIVFDSGELVNYNKMDRYGYLFLAGCFEDTPVDITYPFLWPPMPFLYYGSCTIVGRVVQRLEGWRMKRTDVVRWIRSLSVEQVDLLGNTLATYFENRTGRHALFEKIDDDRRRLTQIREQQQMPTASSKAESGNRELSPQPSSTNESPVTSHAGGSSGHHHHQQQRDVLSPSSMPYPLCVVAESPQIHNLDPDSTASPLQSGAGAGSSTFNSRMPRHPNTSRPMSDAVRNKVTSRKRAGYREKEFVPRFAKGGRRAEEDEDEDDDALNAMFDLEENKDVLLGSNANNTNSPSTLTPSSLIKANADFPPPLVLKLPADGTDELTLPQLVSMTRAPPSDRFLESSMIPLAISSTPFSSRTTTTTATTFLTAAALSVSSSFFDGTPLSGILEREAERKRKLAAKKERQHQLEELLPPRPPPIAMSSSSPRKLVEAASGTSERIGVAKPLGVPSLQHSLLQRHALKLAEKLSEASLKETAEQGYTARSAPSRLIEASVYSKIPKGPPARRKFYRGL